jgi:iron complex transport system substrate-binding protein
MTRGVARLVLHTACVAASLAAPAAASAAVSVLDDRNQTVSLAAPAQRIVSLAPHATELLFAAGAGTKVVGIIEYSDYPPAAKRLPSVGNATMLDIERIVALRPDLVVLWGSGNLAPQVARLRALGIPTYDSEPGDFEAIASSLERLAHLAGTDAAGKAAAASFRARLADLRHEYRQRPVVSVFYQIWREPLMTLNDAHMVSAAIRLCGGRNIFGGLPQIAPAVSVESVLKADPEAIVAGSSRDDDALSAWRRYSGLTAVTRGNLFVVESDMLTRPGPRILDGTRTLCRHLDAARARRKP